MWKWILLAIAGVIVVTGGATLAIRAFAPEPKQIGCRGLEMVNPLGTGVLMSPEEAERAFNPPVIRPQIDVASDESIAELWVRERSPEVYIVYRSTWSSRSGR